MYDLIVGGDKEQSHESLAEAKTAAKQRAYGLTCRSGKTEEVTIMRGDQYIGTATGHITATYRGR